MTHAPARRGKIVSKAEFARLWADTSLSQAEIGKALGISQAAVSMRGQTRGLPPRKSGPRRCKINLALLEEMWRAGVSAIGIGKALGVCERTVRSRAAEMGLPRRTSHDARSYISLAAFAHQKLAKRMAEAARLEQAAMINAEMVDFDKAGRAIGLRHARGMV